MCKVTKKDATMCSLLSKTVKICQDLPKLLKFMTSKLMAKQTSRSNNSSGKQFEISPRYTVPMLPGQFSTKEYCGT